MIHKKTFLAEQQISGFKSPADDHLEGRLDISDRIVVDPHCTFYFRMDSDSMKGYGIPAGALLVVDRSLEPTEGCVVIADLQGELACRVLSGSSVGMRLLSDNSSLLVGRDRPLLVWGVVIAVCYGMLPKTMQKGRYAHVCAL